MCDNSSLRNRLGVRRVSNLLFVSLVGPSLEDFNALPYVKKWLASHHIEERSKLNPENASHRTNAHAQNFRVI